MSGLIVLAAGGTGGHIFPAEALARVLLDRGWRVALVTDRRGQAFDALPAVDVVRIRASSFGRGVAGKLKGALELGIGAVQARGLMARARPAAVVGFGGYPSAPTVFAASQAGVPVLLHEQNAVLGRANRLLVSRAKRIATSFPQVAGIRPGVETVLTGNPVRADFVRLRELPYPAQTPDGPLNLIVLGGSQGARVFGDVIPAALSRLPEALRRRVRLGQQARPEQVDEVRATLEQIGVDAEVSSFFTDVPRRVADSHLAITRAGASTVAELAVIGRPAILVPYPGAMDDHQTANADAFAEGGAGWLMPQAGFNAESLSARLEALLTLPGSLDRAAAAARAHGYPDAAQRLADAVEELAGDGRNGHSKHKDAA